MTQPIIHGFYTSWLKPGGGYNAGFNARPLVPGTLAPDQLTTVSQFSNYDLSGMDLRDLASHPVTLRYALLNSTTALLMEITSSGKDNFGHDGNFFAHAVFVPPNLLEDPAPAFYWHATFWKNHDNNKNDLPKEWEQSSGPGMQAAAELPFPLDKGGISYERLIAYLDEPGKQRRRAATHLLAAIIQRTEGKGVVVCDTSENVAMMAAVLGLALPFTLRPRFTFSTYGIGPFDARYAFLLVGVAPGKLQENERLQRVCYIAATEELTGNVAPSPYAQQAISAIDANIFRDPGHSRLFHFLETINGILDPDQELDASLDAFALLPGITEPSATAPLGPEQQRALDMLLTRWTQSRRVLDTSMRHGIREALKRTINANPASGTATLLQKFIPLDRLATPRPADANILIGDYALFALTLLRARHIGTFVAISTALESAFGAEMASRHLAAISISTISQLAPQMQLDGAYLAPVWQTFARYVAALPDVIRTSAGAELTALARYSISRAFTLDRQGHVTGQDDALVQGLIAFCATNPTHWLRVLRDDANPEATVRVIYEGLREIFRQNDDIRKQLHKIITVDKPEVARSLLLERLARVKSSDVSYCATLVAEASRDVDRTTVRQMLVREGYLDVVNRFRLTATSPGFNEFALALFQVGAMGFLDGANLDAVTMPLLYATLEKAPSDAEAQRFALLAQQVEAQPQSPARDRVAALVGLVQHTLEPAQADTLRQGIAALLAAPQTNRDATYRRYQNIVTIWLERSFAALAAPRVQMPPPAAGRRPQDMPFAADGRHHGALVMALYLASPTERDIFWDSYWPAVEKLALRGQQIWLGLGAVLWFWSYGIREEKEAYLSLELPYVMLTAHALFRKCQGQPAFKLIAAELAKNLHTNDMVYRPFAYLLGNEALRLPEAKQQSIPLTYVIAAGVAALIIVLLLAFLLLRGSGTTTPKNTPTTTPGHGLVLPPSAYH